LPIFWQQTDAVSANNTHFWGQSLDS